MINIAILSSHNGSGFDAIYKAIKDKILDVNIALLISKENGCKMCVDVHKSIAKMLGLSEEKIQEILLGVDSMNNSNKDKALLSFSIKASGKDNYKILKEEIDALKEMGWSDVQIIEAVAITGYFNYINTLSNVFGLGE